MDTLLNCKVIRECIYYKVTLLIPLQVQFVQPYQNIVSTVIEGLSCMV